MNQDLESLEKPDSILQRKLLAVSGNPCKAFMMLELGIVPVRFVIMQKLMQILQYILQESTDSMLAKVFQTQKEDSTKGDFVALTNKDKLELEITLPDLEI